MDSTSSSQPSHLEGITINTLFVLINEARFLVSFKDDFSWKRMADIGREIANISDSVSCEKSNGGGE